MFTGLLIGIIHANKCNLLIDANGSHGDPATFCMKDLIDRGGGY